MFSFFKTKPIDKQLQAYKDWVKMIRVFSNTTIFIFLLVGGVLLYFAIRKESWWLGIFGFYIAIQCVIELSKREGHLEGYFDGVAQGAFEEENKDLDDNMREFKSEIETFRDLNNDLGNSK